MLGNKIPWADFLKKFNKWFWYTCEELNLCLGSYYFYYNNNNTLSINTKENKLNIEYFINKCRCSMKNIML